MWSFECPSLFLPHDLYVCCSRFWNALFLDLPVPSSFSSFWFMNSEQPFQIPLPPTRAKYKHAKSLQSHVTLCDPVDCSPPGSSVHGILQARILEWVAIPFSRRSSQPRDRTQVSHIAGGFSTNWTTREAQKVIIRHQNQAKSTFFPTVLSKCKPKCQKYLAQITVFTKRFPIRIISTIILALIALQKHSLWNK